MSTRSRLLAWKQHRFAANPVGPIGVDFGLERLHMVQFDNVNQPQLRATASLDFDGSRADLLADPKRLRNLLRRGLRHADFSGRRAVVAVPVGLFRTVSINYLAAKGDDDDAVLRVMRERLDGDLSEYVLDYMPVSSRSSSNERLALVAVCERDSVIRLLENLRRAGLVVDALEIGPVAIGRLVNATIDDQDETSSDSECDRNVLVVNSGRNASYLTLISGDDLLFDQQVSFGENELVDRLTNTLDLPQSAARDLMMRVGLESPTRSGDAGTQGSDLSETVAQILKPRFLSLVDEIKRVCLYAAAETRGGGVSNIYLLGSLAHWQGADAMLSSLAGMEVTGITDPLQVFSREGDAARQGYISPELSVATGLALRRAEADG